MKKILSILYIYTLAISVAGANTTINQYFGTQNTQNYGNYTKDTCNSCNNKVRHTSGCNRYKSCNKPSCSSNNCSQNVQYVPNPQYKYEQHNTQYEQQQVKYTQQDKQEFQEPEEKKLFVPYVSLKMGLATHDFDLDLGDVNLPTLIVDKNYNDDYYSDSYYEDMAFINKVLNVVESHAQDFLKLGFYKDNTFSFNPAIGFEINPKNFSKYAAFRAEFEYSKNQESKTKFIDISKIITEILDENFNSEITAQIISHADAYMLNGYIDIKTNHFIKPFVSMGIGYSDFEVNVDIRMPDILPMLNNGLITKDNTTIWSLGGGFGFKIKDNIYLDAQYRYIDYGNLEIGETLDNLFKDIFAGESPQIKFEKDAIRFTDKSHQFLIGIRITF